MPSHSPSPSLFASPTPEPLSTLRKSNLADSSAEHSRSITSQSSTFHMAPSSSSQHQASEATMSTSSSRNRRHADSYQADNRPTKRRRADHSSLPSEPLVITLDDDSRQDMDSRHANIVLPPIRDLLEARSVPASTSVPPGSRQQPIEIDEDGGEPNEPQPQPDGPMSMAQLLGRQQEEPVGSQKSTGDKPVSLRNLTCVICMDKPTDLTAASCGHVFCHTCLMEALIAGENRARIAYEPKRSQCPVCRKNVNRNKKSDVIPLLIMKGTSRARP